MVKEWVWKDIWSKVRDPRELLKSSCLGSGCLCYIVVELYRKCVPAVFKDGATEHAVIGDGSPPIEVAYTYR